MIFTNKYQMPLSLCVWLATDTYVHSVDPRVISVTGLLKPIRAIVLGRQPGDVEQTVDVHDLLAARRGTAVHDSIESAWKSPHISQTLNDLGYPVKAIQRIVVNPTPDQVEENSVAIYTETRYNKEVGNYIVSGEPDYVEHGTVEDFKNIKVYGWMKGSNDDDYLKQLSIYRFLNPKVITNNYGYIRYLFSDWNKLLSIKEKGKGYPQQDWASKRFTLMTLEETESFIVSRLDEIDSLIDLPQKDLPLCTPKELWQAPDEWKYYKNPQNTAKATKRYYSKAEVDERFISDNHCGKIKYFPGKAQRCNYCDVREICEQAKSLIDLGILTP